MTHVYFSARAEGRISYGHLGRTNSCYSRGRPTCSFVNDFGVCRLQRLIIRLTCTEVSGVENIGQCGRLSQLSWLLGAL